MGRAAVGVLRLLAQAALVAGLAVSFAARAAAAGDSQGRAAAGGPAAVEPTAGFAAEIGELLAAFAHRPEQTADFVERRSSPLFAHPVESRGVLRFRAPALLEKETLSPRHERLRIEGDTAQWDLDAAPGTPRRDGGGAGHRSVSLQSVPALAAFAASLRATLGGDLPTLRRYYAAAYEGGKGGRWTLRLQPLDPALRATVEAIELSGAGAGTPTPQLQRVVVSSADGDRSEMTVTPRP